jgi:hypothetical protein
MHQILITVGLTAALTIIGNIIYFEYKSRNEFSRNVLRERLTKLLLPLYFTLEEDELILNAEISNPDGDPYQYESEKLIRLRKLLSKIIANNIYLADDDLHAACLILLRHAYATNADERFQLLHMSGRDFDAEAVEEFKKIVTKQYEHARRQYLGIKDVEVKQPIILNTKTEPSKL